MDPEEQKQEEIERIAGEVLNNMSIATALSILIEKSKEIAENYLDTASEERPQKKIKKTNQEPLFTEKQSLGIFDKIKKIFK
jgi:hypothetical protein